jgi:hypothetical protein
MLYVVGRCWWSLAISLVYPCPCSQIRMLCHEQIELPFTIYELVTNCEQIDIRDVAEIYPTTGSSQR